MTRGILYLPGAGQHLLNQSARLIAELIARNLQAALGSTASFCYRINLRPDARRFGPDIPVDIASIEVEKHGSWVPALEVVELKYLQHFVEPYEQQSAIKKGLNALWLAAINAASTLTALRARRTPSQPRDLAQGTYMFLLTGIFIVFMVYWLLVGVAGIAGIDSLVRIEGWSKEVIAGLVTILAAFDTVRLWFKDVFASAERTAIELYANTAYLGKADDSGVLNTIREAVAALTSEKTYDKIDVLSFSLGAVLAGDAIYPRQPRVWSSPPRVANWLTIGYPYDLITSSRLQYFSGRHAPTMEADKWINVFTEDDFLGSNFRFDTSAGAPDPKLGIAYSDQKGNYRLRRPDPNLNLCFETERAVRQGPLDFLLPLRRARNHYLYWSDQDPGAASCFGLLVKEARWIEDMLALLGGCSQGVSTADEVSPERAGEKSPDGVIG